MNESSTFEFVVTERPEGKRKAFVILARGGMLAVIAAFVFLCFGFNMPAVAILPLCLLGLVLYFWKRFNRDMEYSLTSGIMTFSYIYGGASRKKVLELFVKDMREIAPVTDGTMDHLNQMGVEKDYRFVSSSSADDMYYAVFDRDGKLCVVYFEATEKTLAILYYYNHATVKTKLSH